MEQSFQFKYEKFEIFYLSENVILSDSSIEKLKNYSEATLRALSEFFFEEITNSDVQQIEFTVVCCDEMTIQRLNNETRGIDKTTDVLSFPVHDELRYKDDWEGDFVLQLGDIYICQEVAEKQSKNFNLSFEEEFLHLLIHGFLHLMGFDHEISSEEEKIMEAHEAALMKKTALYLEV